MVPVTAADRERRDRVRRWTKRAELGRRADGDECQLEIGCWAVVVREDTAVGLALVTSVPMPDATGTELVVLHDGTALRADDLVAIDLAGVLVEGAELLRDIRRGRYAIRGDQTGILRVHRAACLARAVDRALIDRDSSDILDALVHLDSELAASEEALRDLLLDGLPNLVASLCLGAALALAGSRQTVGR